MINKENTFIISLPERKYDRLDLLTSEMDKYNFEYTVIEAVKDENGVRGLIFSMQNVFNECLNKGLQSAWILEDDAIFIEHPDYVEKSIKQLPIDFHLLYFGGYIAYKQKKLYSDYLIQVNQIYSTHSIYYSRAGMIKALDSIEYMLKQGYARPYDQLLCNGIQKENKCYASFPMIMKQRSGYSDIEKKEVDYTKWHEDKFEEMTGHLKADSLSSDET